MIESFIWPGRPKFNDNNNIIKKKMNINISCSIIRFTHTPILASFFQHCAIPNSAHIIRYTKSRNERKNRLTRSISVTCTRWMRRAKGNTNHDIFRKRAFCRKFTATLCVCSLFFWCSIQRIHWHESTTMMLPSTMSTLHQNIQPFCYWYRQLWL